MTLLSIPLGRIIFALLFAISFIILAVFAYTKDGQYHKIHYKKMGVQMLLGILIFFVIMYLFVSH